MGGRGGPLRHTVHPPRLNLFLGFVTVNTLRSKLLLSLIVAMTTLCYFGSVDAPKGDQPPPPNYVSNRNVGVDILTFVYLM